MATHSQLERALLEANQRGNWQRDEEEGVKEEGEIDVTS